MVYIPNYRQAFAKKPVLTKDQKDELKRAKKVFKILKANGFDKEYTLTKFTFNQEDKDAFNKKYSLLCGFKL